MHEICATIKFLDYKIGKTTNVEILSAFHPPFKQSCIFVFRRADAAERAVEVPGWTAGGPAGAAHRDTGCLPETGRD